jgi:hypothetical protein
LYGIFCVALQRRNKGINCTRPGWDGTISDLERYPRTKKDTLDLSFIDFGISHSRFFEFRIFQRYPTNLKDILGYPAPGHIPGLSLRHPIDIWNLGTL